MDLIGIEPMTSSMPWYVINAKTLTLQHLRVGRVGKTGIIGTGWCQNAAKPSGPKGLFVWISPSPPYLVRWDASFRVLGGWTCYCSVLVNALIITLMRTDFKNRSMLP